MKIGIDIRTLMDRRYSGISEYTLNLVNEILKLDSENEYKLFYNSGRDISKRMPKFKSDKTEIIHTNYPNKVFNYLMQKSWHYPKIDKLLEVDTFLMPHINFIALSGKSKNILTVHDLSFLHYPEFFSWRKNLWHYIINVKKLIAGFDKIITVSENTKNDIMELCGVDEEKIEVIYSGVGRQYREIKLKINRYGTQAQSFTKEPNGDLVKLDGIRKKYSLPEKFILFLGTLEPRKNVEGLIRAYAELRDNNSGLHDYKLVIAGGRGWKSQDIFKVWEESKYKKDINFLGYIPAEEKVYLYNLAYIFVYPSFYEGFGFPLLEAMACGTPVITSFSSSLPEVAGKAAWLIDPYNIQAIAGALERIITDSELRDLLIEEGKIRAKKFSWENTARKYLEIFNR